MREIMLAAAISLAAVPAFAKTPLPPRRPVAATAALNLNTLVANFNKLTDNDIANAITIASAGNDAVFAACLGEVQNVKKAMEAAGSATTDKIHLISDFAKLRLLALSLRTGSEFSTGCAPFAEEVKSDVLTAISKVAAGGLTLADFGL